MTGAMLRLLFMPRETFPTDRVRINILFGRELLGRGHQIDLVMQAADDRVAAGVHDWFGQTISIGPTNLGAGLLSRVHKHWLGLRHDVSALRAVTPARYDAILVSDKFLTAVIGLAIARRRKVRFMFWLTFPYPEADRLGARTRTARYPWLAALRGFVTSWMLYRWIMPRSDYVFVQSERMKSDVRKQGIDPNKISPIVTGFDLTSMAPVRRTLDPTSDNRIVTLAYLGTLSADRRLEILVDMLVALRGSGMPARLLLVGDADRTKDRRFLEHYAVQRGVASHMEITGLLPQSAALARVRDADIGLSPFYPAPIFLSTSPTKLVEYMALGLPVIANDHPEQRLILRESRAGVRVPWGARHFARAARWLMSRSSAERVAMGERGRAWVEGNRTYARIADDVERACVAVVGNAAITSRGQGARAIQ